MAEVVASIAGIITFGTQVAVLLFKFGSALKSSGEDVGWLGTEITMFCAVLKELKSTLEKARSTGFSLDSLVGMKAILDYCEKILKSIQEVLEGIKPSELGDDVKISLSGRMKWLLNKSVIDKLRLRLESSKTTLNIMMTGFNWALLLEQKGKATVTNEETELQTRMHQVLLMSQQFQLRQLEQDELDHGVAEEYQEDWPLPKTNISDTLNAAIFTDGLTASQRQHNQSQQSWEEQVKMLNLYAQDLVASDSNQIHRFELARQRQNRRTGDQPRYSRTLTVPVVFQDIDQGEGGKITLKDYLTLRIEVTAYDRMEDILHKSLVALNFRQRRHYACCDMHLCHGTVDEHYDIIKDNQADHNFDVYAHLTSLRSANVNPSFTIQFPYQSSSHDGSCTREMSRPV